MNPKKRFTSIKQIPKEAIEMIDEVQWYWTTVTLVTGFLELPERLSSEDILEICSQAQSNGTFDRYLYIEPNELEDKTYGINLYKKIHGEEI
jgi:hypothetical protein